MKNCIGWLKEEIGIIKPKAIIAVGQKSFNALNRYPIQPVLMVNHYAYRFVSDEEYEEQFKTLRYFLNSRTIKHGLIIADLMTKEQRMKLESQYLFRGLIDLLDKLKMSGKISAAQWRTYRDQWQESRQGRNALVQRLSFMLENND